jgi:hypothetical protein
MEGNDSMTDLLFRSQFFARPGDGTKRMPSFAQANGPQGVSS